MAQNQYEHYDTAAWPDAGPLKTAFAGSAALFFPPTNEPYEDYEDGWVPWVLFTVDEGEDDTVELFNVHAYGPDTWGDDLAGFNPGGISVSWSSRGPVQEPGGM